MTQNSKCHQFSALWRIQVVWLVVILSLFAGDFQTKGRTVYAQSAICTDRPANERATPPASVWVEVETHYGEWGETKPVAREVTFDFYISGVLLGELGASPDNITDANLPSNDGVWKDTMLEAMAVAIRSFTWFRLNYASQFTDPHDITLDNTDECGFWDEKIESGQQINAQSFRPFQQGVSQAIRDYYAAIVSQHVPDIYLVEGTGTNPIDAQYRATVGENSDPGNADYLVSIYDPISAGDTDPTNASGMGQWGAQRWAMGQNDAGETFARWSSYQQILFHYYSGVNLRVTEGALLYPPPDVDRFNVLRTNATPSLLRPGRTYQTPRVWLQNTGVNDWTVTELAYTGQPCNSSQTNLSYHLYQLNNIDLACGDQQPEQGEDPGGKACFEGHRNEICIAGSNSLKPGQSISVDNVNIFIPAPADLLPGHYWLRWDVEFVHSGGDFPPTWGSRLQIAPYREAWFTQNKLVVIGKNNYPELTNLDSSSHQTNVWSSDSFVTMEWDEPIDTIATDYYRYRWQADNYEGTIWHDPDSWECDGWRCTNTLETLTGLPDSDDWEIEIYGVATDGETNNPYGTLQN